MPAAKNTSSAGPVTVTLLKGDEKRHSWRYDADKATENPALTSAYIRKEDVAALGNPDKITVTITAAVTA